MRQCVQVIDRLLVLLMLDKNISSFLKAECGPRIHASETLGLVSIVDTTKIIALIAHHISLDYYMCRIQI